ncbi:hypothetical protein [Demequina sp. NBRC 110056]|uniref:LppM family (lipo)protein n=1 Tax=Demequina sp. NBRC 110056 TaxID=1570345 RepID=UPI000A035231|nr:hypothetical protein [Demequina sp. NBRC 110056]
MRRPLRWVAAAAFAAAALTGCVRVTSDTAFSSDLTFSQHAVIAFDESAASQFAQQQGLDVDLDGLVSQAQESGELADLQDRYPGQIEVADYDDGELTGVEITISDLPVDELATAAQEAAGLGAEASVEVVDGSYVLALSRPDELDLSGMGVSASSLELAATAVDVEVTYTFPGRVSEATAGEVPGNTVTLSLVDLATAAEIRIVAAADDQIDWGPWLTWGGFGLGAALVIGGAAALVIQDRRKRRETPLPPPVVGTDATGPGVLSPEANPQEATPPEGDEDSEPEPPHRLS